MDLPSNSHHQDYYIFRIRKSQPKPSFAAGILGGEGIIHIFSTFTYHASLLPVIKTKIGALSALIAAVIFRITHPSEYCKAQWEVSISTDFALLVAESSLFDFSWLWGFLYGDCWNDFLGLYKLSVLLEFFQCQKDWFGMSQSPKSFWCFAIKENSKSGLK